MCDRDTFARSLLYIYVLGLWSLSYLVYTFCNHLLQLNDCMTKQISPLCQKFFTDYSWDNAAGVIGCLYSVNVSSFTVMSLYILYRRCQMRRNEVKPTRLYSHMVR